MNPIETLFYKSDDNTNQMRLSKTKVISSIVFILFFIFSINMYLTTSPYKDSSIIVILITSILFGLIFAIPTFIVGWLINKLLNRNKHKKYSNNTNYNHTVPQNNVADNKTENNESKNSSEDYAKQFKNAVEIDDVNLASNILSKWNKNDANYKYATLIFEGMPPSELSLTEMNELLSSADNMKATNESLKEWYRSTAVEVINLNK